MTFDAATRFAVRGSGLLRGLAGLAALGLSAMVFVGAVSDYYAIARPEVALAWSPGHPEALAEAAERSFEAGDPEARRAAFDLARRVMISSPLAPTPLRLLALEAEEREEQAKAVKLMRLAAERSPRDAKAQIWLADQALLADDYGAGLERVDALLRIWPGLGSTLFPALAQMSTEEEASAALIDTIRKNPPWRRALLAAMPSTVDPPGLMAAFYLRAMVGEGALTDRDLRPFLQTLINQGFPDLARSIWLASLSEERRLDAEGITNGDFDYPITGIGFDWRIKRAEGADVRVSNRPDPRQDSEDRLLRKTLGVSAPVSDPDAVARSLHADRRLEGEQAGERPWLALDGPLPFGETLNLGRQRQVVGNLSLERVLCRF